MYISSVGSEKYMIAPSRPQIPSQTEAMLIAGIELKTRHIIQ